MTAQTIQDLGDQVPATCEHPGCTAQITRRRVNTCGADPTGGIGCGLNFCGAHLQGPNQTCERCAAHKAPFNRKAAVPDLLDVKLTSPAWARWRQDNPDRAMKLAAEKGERLRKAKEPEKSGKP